MLDAAKEAVKFAAGKSRKDLDNERMLTLAITKAIEIIGEAAYRVTEPCKSENDNIPWSDISAMRNRLIHGYFDINLDIVWETIQTDLPELIESLENILSTE
jgi:uncharacterized protein with HEPN domain